MTGCMRAAAEIQYNILRLKLRIERERAARELAEGRRRAEELQAAVAEQLHDVIDVEAREVPDTPLLENKP